MCSFRCRFLRSVASLLLVGPCTAMFEDPLFWQTEKVFRFTSTVSQRLQAPDLPFHLYSEPETPSSRPAVSFLQWFRRCRFQAFRFTCRVGQKLQVAGFFLFHLYSGSQTRGCRPSAVGSDSSSVSQCNFVPGSSSEAPFHLDSSSNFSSAACQRFARQKSAQHVAF